MKIKNQFIAEFIKNLPPNLQSPLDNIICKMLESSKYIDDSTLLYDENGEYDKEHYHNWDCNPTVISELKNRKIKKQYNEDNDIELTNLLGNHSKPNIECVKGDIQLGKRVHACILMWISMYIYERPTCYGFRNINIDKEQLQDDIDGTQSWNFNIEWIKNKFNTELDNGYSNKKYFDYKLPSLTEIKDKKVANKLADKEYISNPNMIYMALMNTTDLETLNKKFYEYIVEYGEKVNITLIIDESDLISPTAKNSNDVSEKDTKNSKSEKLLSRLISKVAHTFHITGTAHPFFWNYTTALSNDKKTHIPVEKVFVMKRHLDYFGFMKNNINFSSQNSELPTIKEWWSKGRGVSKEDRFEIMKDYDVNIKKIIQSITKRKRNYNSFLISEEIKRDNQKELAEKIIEDFDSVFCIVFHGKQGKNGLPTGLRLYFPKNIDDLNIEKELQQVVVSEGSNKRLDKPGGIKGIPTSDSDNKYYDYYKYYDIDMKSKEFNIKMVYKVLAMLFKKIKSNKTVITITGKYGERGYSFTSDYYKDDNKYVLHLTDQYYVSHASDNCTDIFQRGRIQGRYTDNPDLIFWTTKELVKLIDQYVDFITKIENKIMSLPRGHAYIRNLCEIILIHKSFVKTLGRLKHRQNLEYNCIKYNRKNNAMIYWFTPDLDHNKYEEHFSNWCKEQDIPFNGFINKLEISEKNSFDYTVKRIYNYKICDSEIYDNEIFNKKLNTSEDTNEFIKKYGIKLPQDIWYDEKIKHIKDNKFQDRIRIGWCILNIDDIKNSTNALQDRKFRWYLFYDQNKLKLACCYLENKEDINECKNELNILEKKNYCEKDNKIIHSKLNYKYINDNFLGHELNKEDKEDVEVINENSYFFLTADGHAYHHDPKKSIDKVKLQITADEDNEIDNPMQEFYTKCIVKIVGSKRIGIKNVMSYYNNWAKKKNIKIYNKLKDFRENFETSTGLKRSKVNINGYQIELKV
jgi:hypothetical protein